MFPSTIDGHDRAKRNSIEITMKTTTTTIKRRTKASTTTTMTKTTENVKKKRAVENVQRHKKVMIGSRYILVTVFFFSSIRHLVQCSNISKKGI